MFSYLQMPFLQALGYAIANSLWQIALLWLIVTLVNTMVKQSSHVRYVTALSAQIAGFVWFLTTFQFYYNHCHAASLEAERLLTQNAVIYTQNGITDNNNILSFLIRAEETLPYLSVAYLLLLSFLIVKWVRNFRSTRHFTRYGLTEMDEKWQRFINEMSDRLDILQNVKIYISSLAKSPMTIGYLKPIILLPLASINNLTEDQLEAVLLHELAHIKRADYIINILVSVAEIILFFNPFTRLLSRQIQKERENCCDDWVLQFDYNAGMYAEALLRIAYLQRENGFQMNAAGDKKGELLQRVKRMVQPGEKTFNYKHQIAALVMITGLLFSIAWLQPNTYYPQPAKNNLQTENKPVVIAPLTAQIDNPFFNAASLFSKSLQADVNQSVAELDKKIVDSITKKSPDETQNALVADVPETVATVTGGNWQKVMAQAQKEAQRNLEAIDWKAVQKEAPVLIDSALILSSVKSVALNKDLILNGVQIGLQSAKDQLLNLQQLQAGKTEIANAPFLQQILTSTFAGLQEVNIGELIDSIKINQKVFENIVEEQKKTERRNKAKQEEAIKQLKDRIEKAAAEARRHATEWQAKQQKDIVIPLPPSPPAAPGIPAACAPGVTQVTFTTSGNDNKTAYQFNTEPAVFRLEPQVTATSYAKSVHVLNRTDNNNLNIIIEIR